MSNISYELNQSLNLIYKIAEKDEIDAIYMFGSYASGTAHTNSDVDLIIVSDSFFGLSQYIRRKIILSQHEITGIKIDPVCMTNADFQKYRCSNAFIGEKPILVYGGTNHEARINKLCK